VQVYGGTVLLSLEVTAINLLVATIIALFLVRRSPTVRFGLLMAFVLPLFMSYIIKIYSIRGILGQRGILNEFLIGIGVINEPLAFLLFSQTAIFLTLAIVYLPYAILPIYLSIERIPQNIIEASADLGGNLKDEIFRVVLPLGMPGLVVAAVFTFVLTFGDFITPQMVGGTEGFTFGRIVYGQFGLALNWPLGAALAVIMMLTALLAVGLAGAITRRRGMQ
jgi:spermidine/putrescine transport system permease protein